MTTPGHGTIGAVAGDRLLGRRTRGGGTRTEPVATLDGVWEEDGGRVSLRFLSTSWSAVPSPVTREVARGWLIRAWWTSLAVTVLGLLLYQMIGDWPWLWYLPAIVSVGMLAGWLCLRALGEAVALLDDFFGIRRRLRRPVNGTRQMRRRPPETPRYVVNCAAISRVWVDQRFLRATVTVRTVDGRGVTYRVFGPKAPGRLIGLVTDRIGRERIIRQDRARARSRVG